MIFGLLEKMSFSGPDPLAMDGCFGLRMSEFLEGKSKNLELLTGSVFFGRYRSVFLGIYHTDTEGKLGRYFQCRRYEKVRIYSK